MASRNSVQELNLNNAEDCEIWMTIFEASARSKKIKDTDKEYGMTDLFISTAGIDAVRQVAIMCRPTNLEELKYYQIKEVILKNTKPQKKITLAERARFMQVTQDDNENILNYLQRLREKAKFCEFEMLNSAKSNQSAEDELIQMRLIDGLASHYQKQRILEMIQTQEVQMTLTQCVDIIQQLEMIKIGCVTNSVKPLNPIEESQLKNVSEINYQSKMVKNCKFCGRNHPLRNCPAFGKKCTKCSKLNHFASVCKSKVHCVELIEREHNNNNDSNVSGVWSIHTNPQINQIERKMENIRINDKLVPMQIDTGADTSVISTKIWKDIFGSRKLEKFHQILEVYDEHRLTTRGKMIATVERNGKFLLGDIIIVESSKPFGLLGRNFLDMANSIMFNQNQSSAESTEILPVIKGVKATMELKENSKSRFCRARPVPLALESKVNDELERLERLGIISPVTGGVENCSPVVWVRKSNDQLRCCADFKVHVNDKIKTDSYPIPNIETIFAKLKNAKVFAKIDLKSAYWQIELDEKAKELSIINTTKGLFKMNRLTMGMKNASSIFQRVMESILSDIKGILIYQDDVAIFADNPESLSKRLTAVKTRLKEKNITINEDKSIEHCEYLTFLGFRISSRGIEPDDKLVKKIREIKAPMSCKEVEQFLGLVNYFGRLIPNYASKVQPLNKLRNAKSFEWTPECNQSFELMKKEISSQPVLQPYSLEKEATLTTDASQTTIAAVLTQEGYPVIFISRNLSKSEQNYANIEREALAVCWATIRLKQFLMGRQFRIITDHQPLVKLFGKHPIPTGTSARICKWALDLMSYDYDILYSPGKQIPHVDALSRLKYESDFATDEDISVDKCINGIHFEERIFDIEEIYNELKLDNIAKSIIHRVKTGNWSGCSEVERPFKRVADALTIQNGLLYLGTRLYIPPRLRQKAFEKTHSDRHAGIQSNINRLILAAWWPGLHLDVERMTRLCNICNKIRPNIMKTCNKWPNAEPFERMHMDWAYIKDAGNVLIVVDAGTGWIEAFQTHNRSTVTVINCLRTVFTRFGIPKLLVSDNAPEFISDDLLTWLSNQGTDKRESPPYFPKSNGLAERSVQTVKKAMMAWTIHKTHQNFSSFLQRILFHHRISSSSKGKSPAELVFNRKLRIPIVTQFNQGQTISYNPKNQETTKATYLMTKGANTSWILHKDNLTLASNNQIAPLEEEEEENGRSESDETDSNDNNTALERNDGIRRSSRSRQGTIRYGIDT